MAEIVVSALLSVVFKKLASAALTKLGRSKKIHSDLEESKRSLEQIQDLLNDASKKEIKEEGVKKWLNRLQHLAYDMDDILDSLTTDALAEEQAAAGNILTKVKNRISSSTTIMHGKLKKISIELQKLYDEKNKLGLEENVGRSLDRNRKYQGPKPPGVITGREGEKKILVQQLLADREPCDQNNFRVVPIVGMGGVGKTTLARLLYNEPKVEEHFDLKAWVCVSDEEFDSFKIGRLIFESVAKEHKIFENSSVLQEALSGQLFGKRFLLVLDDVWTESIEDWETLMPAFLAVAPGSKIIITTRKTNLIQHLKYGNPNYNPFHLNKLSDEDSLSLFAHYALDSNNFDSNPTLKPHGEAIMRKCEGLPLALKALGRLLSTKTHEDEWKEVSESELWGLKDADDVLPALRLSYLELSPCLKQLFAYTCLFPKDCVFEKEDLIWLWMAEGFLHETTNKSMERLGEEYFDELLSRSFFECVDNDTSLFVMHDLMNDLATSVAGEFFVRLDTEMKKTIVGKFIRYTHKLFGVNKSKYHINFD